MVCARNVMFLYLFFVVPGRGRSSASDIEAMKPLMQIVFHLLEKVSKVRLGKEVHLTIQ